MSVLISGCLDPQRSASAMMTMNTTRTKIASGAVLAMRFVWMSSSGLSGDSAPPGGAAGGAR